MSIMRQNGTFHMSKYRLTCLAQRRYKDILGMSHISRIDVKDLLINDAPLDYQRVLLGIIMTYYQCLNDAVSVLR